MRSLAQIVDLAPGRFDIVEGTDLGTARTVVVVRDSTTVRDKRWRWDLVME